MSFFTAGKIYGRHIVLGEKERLQIRRHGAMLFNGPELLPTEATLCATCWMHGVFAAQLTIGNTSFHKLFSVSRDPYNITRGSGLRMLIEGRMAPPHRAVRLRNRPRRLSLGLSLDRPDCHDFRRCVRR
jgi:cellobiose phosphorylase